MAASGLKLSLWEDGPTPGRFYRFPGPAAEPGYGVGGPAVGGPTRRTLFLGYVDKLGVAYEAPTVATGFGAYLAQPLMREYLENKVEVTKAEARALVERCLKVLYYRDARSYNRVSHLLLSDRSVPPGE
ncbi:hypothetical protein CRUP_000622 [Coryphaenoides rupestris]|nr:hypothetical protein CRUP_000622 [Coryphaenoides rupestris]